MIRLGATQLDLEARDLSWHRQHFEQRQIAREQEAKLQARANAAETIISKQTESHTLPIHSSDPHDVSESDKQAIYSTLPIPRGSSQFWRDVVPMLPLSTDAAAAIGVNSPKRASAVTTPSESNEPSYQ